MKALVIIFVFLSTATMAQVSKAPSSKIPRDTAANAVNEMLRSLKDAGRVAVYGIQFVGNTEEIKRVESSAALLDMSKLLKSNPILDVFVVGHTDLAGTLEFNKDLSARRAAAVVKLLVEEYGVTNTQLTPHGVGPLAPVATNQTEEGRKKNNRIELVER